MGISMVSMKCRLLLLASVLCLLPWHAKAQAVEQAPEQGFVVERTVWIKPGRIAQYLTLFERVERPRLEELRRQGKVLWYRTAQPLLAGRNEDWDWRMTIAWRSPADAAEARPRALENGRGTSGASPVCEKSLLEDLVADQHQQWVVEVPAKP